MKNDLPNFSSTYEMLLYYANERPAHAAILTPGRQPLDYQTLWEQVRYVVNYLQSRGLERNDRVAIVLPNGGSMAVALLSVISAYTVAPLNPAYTAVEYEYYLRNMRASAILTQKGMETPIRDVAALLGIPVFDIVPDNAISGIFKFVDLNNAVLDDADYAGAGDIALVLFTSGTTSKPKLVLLTQKNYTYSARNMALSCKLMPDDRCLNVMPLFHAHAIMSSLSSSIFAGASIICTSGFDSDVFFTCLAEFKPSWYTSVPTIHQSIINLADKYEREMRSCVLRFVRSASSPLPLRVIHSLESLFNTPVIECYGMTEACSQIASNPLPPLQRKPLSVGLATGCEIAIHDDDKQPVLAGEKGEIVVRGQNITSGYEDNPEANKQAFRDTWFYTGDQGYIDEDGYLFITGRIKEIINRGGQKVTPQEVERRILEHPVVQQAVVFALPHETLGETVGAAIVLEQGTSLEERQLQKHLSKTLTSFKIPSRVFVLDEIPKGPTGKVQRIGLGEKLLRDYQIPFQPIKTSVERQIADMWKALLKHDQIGREDNFFDLGGNSLLLTELHHHLEATFQIRLDLIELFEYPTLQSLSDWIEKQIKNKDMQVSSGE